MSTHSTPSTLVEALEIAARAPSSRGYRFYQDEGGAEPFFSYAGVERASARHGGALQALGLRKGDRVALVLPDHDDFLFTVLGAVRAGIIPVPIYPPIGLGAFASYLDNMRHVVAKSGARALVTTAKIKRLLGSVEAACPALKKVIAIDALREAREELKPVKIGPDDIALLQFTSGSISRPKGVVISHANLTANVRAINQEGLRITPEDVGVSWLPLYHDMGLIGFVIAPIFDQVPVVLLSPLTFLKRPASWLRALSRHKGTISYGPNFAFALAAKRIRAAEIEGVDLSRWRVAGCGAEPIRAGTLDAFARMFEPYGFSRKAFVPSYGMAEATLAVSFEMGGQGAQIDSVHAPSLSEEGVARPVGEGHPEAVTLVRCGRAFEGHAIQIFALDDDLSATPLPDRSVGEIRLRGPSVMHGYYDDRDLTTASMAGGWFRTGDIGYLVDGELVLCGRLRELIIVNGRNFYPQDIEWEAGKAAAVRKGNVVAFGLPGAPDRERVVVVFETSLATAEEQAQGASEVRQLIQEGIGLTVDDVCPVPQGVLPKTSSGKLQRLLTRKLYEQNELDGRKSPRELDRVDLARELLRSQLAYMASKISRNV
jgi:fatty-acyl-CoA synthase